MPELRERLFELGTPVLPFVHDAVDVLELLVLLVAEPRVHKHEPVVVLDEEAAQRQGNAVALVGRNATRSEEHTSELQSRLHLVCRLLLEKKKHPRRAPKLPL